MENETNFHFMRCSAGGIHKYFLPMWKADISFHEKQTLYECVKSAMCERLLLSYFIVAENY